MSDNQPCKHYSYHYHPMKRFRPLILQVYNDLNMIAVSTVAAQLALDVRGPVPPDAIDHIVPRLRFLARQQSSNADQEFLRIWNDSQTKKDFDDFDPAVTTEASEGLKIVWRVCLRVFWTSPHEILSSKNDLRYRPTPPPGMEASHVVFTPKFSRLFAKLAVHPCWDGYDSLLVMAIQYTVKVRLDCRLSWPIIDGLPYHVEYCPALESLSEMFDDNGHHLPATASIQQMHLQAREALTGATPSEFSDFLVFLGQIARMYPSSDYSQRYLGISMLPVTTKDLQILTMAVKRFDWENIDWKDTPKAVFEAFERKGGLSDDQYPRNNQELKRFIRRALRISYHSVAGWRDRIRRTDLAYETPSDNEVLPGDESGFESD
ncbi:hypothetical protein FDENT_13115 [Fusarium denticulatum]|uniref:Uncharacterized protein n=1 Tax=Fusarium denticulatum TaxID=48507 RepID=A0A8H5WMN7_9HYPO|nr:hypothetical protein FDENT_13115 [Fusarium denticulatum]